jgi:hypothetical protein
MARRIALHAARTLDLFLHTVWSSLATTIRCRFGSLSQFSDTFQTDATPLSPGSSNAAIAGATGASALGEPEALQASSQIQE